MPYCKFFETIKATFTAIVLIAIQTSHCALGATTDISNVPLFTSSNTNVHPNILFILDDSGSMTWDYLPDDAPYSPFWYGYMASQCNGLAYNPQINYIPPVRYDGTSYPPATYPRALIDGYNPNSSTTNLSSNSNKIYYIYNGTQTKLNYSYSASGNLNSNTAFYSECFTQSDSASSLFTAVDISKESTAQQQNYANWQSYYSTRILLMKTSVGLAFSGIDAKYRVGFTVINNQTTDASEFHSSSRTRFLNPAEFDVTPPQNASASQKQAFYNNLYATRATLGTPLRGALSLAGQYYARKANGQVIDPVQYSCQKNFTILSTDGYWNLGGESNYPPKFGPYKLDRNTSVGQQDGDGTPRPLFDGGSIGISDSLADIAMYYYTTDLRDPSLGNCTGALGSSVCDNNVAGALRDNANHQHMTTFTLGLGNSGTLKFDGNYLNQSAGDYADLVQGTKNWPQAGPNGSAVNIDDLWHAAVNGRGQFFSATDPTTLINSLRTALDAIKAITGSASAATTGALQPTEGNNGIYIANFTSSRWYGDVLSYSIDPRTGFIDTTTPTWSAQRGLDAADPASRYIYYSKSGALRAFTYSNLSADSLQGNFDNFCDKAGVGGTNTPVQCVVASNTSRTLANSGSNLVDYLRGVKDNANDMVYRSRDHRLGDIINASPVYVGQPSFSYTEHNYQSFRATSRNPVVYAAANDGMLHALDAGTGSEKWAYIPSVVMPNLYKLADINYAGNHLFLLDGSPVTGDIYANFAWKSILIGGFNSGGRGYYALDITTPESPQLLWEFTDTDLGYTFGNPIITKLRDGTWVVIFASGYNNINSGDGNGHLYVVNANTGALVMKMDTNIAGSPAGSPSTPSGLAKINNYVISDVDNTTEVVYGGDLLGNVWRFDINRLVQPYQSSQLLAQLKVSGRGQPITTRPALAEVTYNGVKYKVLYVGTGKYLGNSDLANSDQQTIYALKDNWDQVGLGDVRAATSPAMVVQTATAVSGSDTITGTARSVDWANDLGWYLDLIGNGERVTVNPLLVLNALYVGTNIPNTDACTVGGTSWLYKMDIANGGALSTSENGAIATSLGNFLVMGMSNVQLTTKNVATIVSRSDGTLKTVEGAQPTQGGPKRRTSWRLLN